MVQQHVVLSWILDGAGMLSLLLLHVSFLLHL